MPKHTRIRRVLAKMFSGCVAYENQLEAAIINHSEVEVRR
jgi:hypothetical protein